MPSFESMDYSYSDEVSNALAILSQRNADLKRVETCVKIILESGSSLAAQNALDIPFVSTMVLTEEQRTTLEELAKKG